MIINTKSQTARSFLRCDRVYFNLKNYYEEMFWTQQENINKDKIYFE